MVRHIVISRLALVLFDHANVEVDKDRVNIDPFVGCDEGTQVLEGCHFDPLGRVLRELLEDIN